MPGCRWLRDCWLGLSLLFAVPGCSSFVGLRDYLAYNDPTNDFVLGYRNQVWARKSWHENRKAFVGQAYLDDFGEGYRAGYREVASGGNGCPPPLPPRSYWTWKYQTAEGQGKVAAWFSGFPHGARAAECDGAGNWMQIQVSHQVQTQYSPQFQDGTLFLSEEVMQEFYPPQVPQPGGLRIDALSPPDELPAPFPAGGSARLPHADSPGPRAP